MRDRRERLRDMLEAIAAIGRHTHCNKKTFENDELLQGWFVRHLEIIGDAAQALPEEVLTRAGHPLVGNRRDAQRACSRLF